MKSCCWKNWSDYRTIKDAIISFKESFYYVKMKKVDEMEVFFPSQYSNWISSEVFWIELRIFDSQNDPLQSELMDAMKLSAVFQAGRWICQHADFLASLCTQWKRGHSNNNSRCTMSQIESTPKLSIIKTVSLALIVAFVMSVQWRYSGMFMPAIPKLKSENTVRITIFLTQCT